MSGAVPGVLELPEIVEYLDVYLWARPVLARGLLVKVQSWEGRVVAGALLFPRHDVPLTAEDVAAVTGRDLVTFPLPSQSEVWSDV